MSDESPTLEDRVGWLEDRMDAIEGDFETTKAVLSHWHNASAILFGELVTFLITKELFEREDLIRFLHTRIELDAIERRQDRHLIDALRSRLDILRRESLHEEIGPEYRENEEKLLARTLEDHASRKARARAARAKRKSAASPQPSEEDASPRGDASLPDAT